AQAKRVDVVQEPRELGLIYLWAKCGKMALQTEGLNRHATSQSGLEEGKRHRTTAVICRLSRFATPIIVDQQAVRIGSARSVIRFVDIARAECLEPEGLAQSIFSSISGRDCFVDDIPRPDTSPKMAHN